MNNRHYFLYLIDYPLSSESDDYDDIIKFISSKKSYYQKCNTLYHRLPICETYIPGDEHF